MTMAAITCCAPPASRHLFPTSLHSPLLLQSSVRPNTSSQRRVWLQVGLWLLQSHVFIHLGSNEGKFLLLLEMLHKLYALVNFQCCEDNPDALTHHEILLPGQLLCKVLKEKAEDALIELAETVRCNTAVLWCNGAG